MSTVAAAKTARNQSDTPTAAGTDVQSFRETVESIVIAFILAFLFRAFVAEAFVIPTGSMAPTLMGAHKDIICEHCGRQYQAGASKEFDQDESDNVPLPRFRRLGFSQQKKSGIVTVASTCADCRGVNAYDLRGNANHATFSGDRILVSKFDYVLANPKRWDVFVFKYPREARMNYIKRLVGLPGEQLLIRDGDVFTKSPDGAGWSIARKPPHKIQAMRRVVSDTQHIAPILTEQGWPSLWQPLDENPSGWQVENRQGNWSAELPITPTKQWLRYYHNFVSEADWLALREGQAIQPAAPKSSRLITDYLAYNSSYLIPGLAIYNEREELNESIQGEVKALDVALELAAANRINVIQEDGGMNDGFHWVGDLLGEYDVEVGSQSGTLLLDLVEFGIHYQCAIDVASGKATLSAIEDGRPVALFSNQTELTAQTAVRGAGNYRLQMANFDDQIVLWVNGRVAQFDQPSSFDSSIVRSGAQRRPYWSESDPLDAAPLAIGGQQIKLLVKRAAVYRDIYYIAVQNTMSNDYSDYDWGNPNALLSEIPQASERNAKLAISEMYAHPDWWAESNLFAMRGELRFELDQDQYFPMGDNSSASSDARAWRGHNYVEKKFLLGKALLVFWPHTWNRPIPFTPNFARMGRIR